MSSDQTESDCACGRGPGHIRIKTTGCEPLPRPASQAESGPSTAVVEDESLDYLDGLHHAWCKHCYPQWAGRPLGAELGVPFTAWCGQRAVFLAIWQSDDTPPGPLCSACWSDPLPPCATCGGH